MLSNNFHNRVQRLIAVSITERQKQLPIEIGRAKSEFAAHGSLRSGRCALRVREICEREIEIRAAIIWKAIVRVIGTYKEESEDLATDLKQFLNNQIQDNFEEISNVLNQSVSGIVDPDKVLIDEARNHAISTHDIEIDLFVDTRSTNKPEAGSIEPGASYHFYGNVGSVQTGDRAQANVIQNLGSNDLVAIQEALALARDAISMAAEIAESQRNELIEIVDDATTELEKPNPNSTKLNTLFLTIATTIQTFASAKPAYQALKGALVPLGITLP